MVDYLINIKLSLSDGYKPQPRTNSGDLPMPSPRQQPQFHRSIHSRWLTPAPTCLLHVDVVCKVKKILSHTTFVSEY